MKKPLILIIGSSLIGIIAFIFLGKWIGWEEIGSAFSVFTFWQGGIIILLTIIISLIGNLRWKEILSDQGIDISFLRLFKIYLGGYSIMYLFPAILLAGEFFRIYGLGKERGLSWKRTAPSVIIERILEWTVNLLVIFLGLFLFVFNVDLFPPKVVFVFGIAFLIFLFALVFFYTTVLRKKSIVHMIVKKYKEEESGLIEVENKVFDYFDLKSKPLKKGLLLSFLRAVAMQLRVWILIIFLGQNIGLLHSFSILGFSYLSAMIPIPASLGTHEVIQIAAFRAVNLTASMAAAFTLIIRAAEIVLSSFGLIYIVKMGFNLMNNTYENKQNS